MRVYVWIPNGHVHFAEQRRTMLPSLFAILAFDLYLYSIHLHHYYYYCYRQPKYALWLANDNADTQTLCAPAQIHINSNVKLITEFNFSNSYDDSRWGFRRLKKKKRATTWMDRVKEMQNKFYCERENFHWMVLHICSLGILVAGSSLSLSLTLVRGCCYHCHCCCCCYT